jgi:hypothetical protein
MPASLFVSYGTLGEQGTADVNRVFREGDIPPAQSTNLIEAGASNPQVPALIRKAGFSARSS